MFYSLLLLIMEAIAIYYFCDLKKLKHFLLTYNLAIKGFLNIFTFKKNIEIDKLQILLNKIVKSGITFFLYLLIFLLPYFIVLILFVNSVNFNSKIILLLLPSIPYLILKKKK